MRSIREASSVTETYSMWRASSALDARHIEYVAVTDDASLIDRIAELLSRQRLASSRRRR